MNVQEIRWKSIHFNIGISFSFACDELDCQHTILILSNAFSACVISVSLMLVELVEA